MTHGGSPSWIWQKAKPSGTVEHSLKISPRATSPTRKRKESIALLQKFNQVARKRWHLQAKFDRITARNINYSWKNGPPPRLNSLNIQDLQAATCVLTFAQPGVDVSSTTFLFTLLVALLFAHQQKRCCGFCWERVPAGVISTIFSCYFQRNNQ